MSHSMTVRTRFAPSPTGYLHIGGVRTALFNWLFARKHGGQFILRIDDTDQKRHDESTLKPILDGFRWLGIDWDEGPEVGGPYAPYFQSQRSGRYQQAVDQLLASGSAYRDYATTEEIQAERDAAEKSKTDFLYSRRWMAETAEDAARFEAEGRQAVVRLKMPRAGTCVFDDAIRGHAEFAWNKEQDHVIQRTDGASLYHLANVVDDHDFKITHVIRAIEHFSNTPRQIFIGQQLGYDIPVYAHIPFVAAPGGQKKLSKRELGNYLKHREFKKLVDYGQSIMRRMQVEPNADTFNPVLVGFYEAIDYLPHALLNYLLLLGWSLDDSSEFFSRDEMIQHFSLERIVKSPAAFDPLKLMAFQDHYSQQIPLKQKVASAIPYLQRAGLLADPIPCERGDYVTQIVTAAADRIKVASDILDYDDFFLADDQLVYDQSAFEKRILKPAEAIGLLESIQPVLEQVEPFDATQLETAIKQFVDAQQIKIGQIINALRVAVTGKAVGFGTFDTLAILGRERVANRLRLSVAKATRDQVASE
jgi:glutamyl-tRNA synthetase